MVPIPSSHEDILHKRSFANLATVDERRRPHVTPVWVDYDGKYILINSAKGRKKDRYMRAHPYVGLSILDPDNPYRYVGIQGVIVEVTEEGAEEHINKLAQKYWGRGYGQLPAGEVRVMYKIKPEKVWVTE